MGVVADPAAQETVCTRLGEGGAYGCVTCATERFPEARNEGVMKGQKLDNAPEGHYRHHPNPHHSP